MNHLEAAISLKKRLGGRNLFLIGMMGSGKSATGPFLAKYLGYSFVDSDKLLEEASKKTISAIFEEDGEQKFRSIETQILQTIGQHYSLVVATGGGVVVKPQNWGILHQGVVIWLDPGKERLLKRLNNDPGERPLLKNQEQTNYFEKLLIERNSLYQEADIHIEIADESAESVSLKIIQKLTLLINSQEDLA